MSNEEPKDVSMTGDPPLDPNFNSSLHPTSEWNKSADVPEIQVVNGELRLFELRIHLMNAQGSLPTMKLLPFLDYLFGSHVTTVSSRSKTSHQVFFASEEAR